MQGAAGVAAMSLLERAGVAAGQAARPNIVWVMADQFRKQALGFMKQDSVWTPNLDRMASEGAAFTNAISAVPICTPNRCVEFSGRYSVHTNVLANGCSLMPEYKTLGDYAKAAGYQTGYIGKWHLGDRQVPGSDSGYVPPELRHGFETFYVTQGITPFAQTYFDGDAKTRTAPAEGWAPDNEAKRAAAFVAGRDKAKPFCLVVSFGPPHNGNGPGYDDRFMPREYAEYEAWVKGGKKGKRPPATLGYASKPEDEALYVQGGKFYRRPIRANAEDSALIEESKCIQGYFGAVTGIDRAVGTILKVLDDEGVADNTIVLFTADHGEMMCSHGDFAKDKPFQESIGIPLIVRWPGRVKAGSYAMPVNSVDLLPTLLGLAAVQGGETDGQDLSPLLRGRKQATRELAYGAFYYGAPTEEPRHFRAVYAKDVTYVVGSNSIVSEIGREVMWDRTTDPYEMKPVHRGMGRDKELDAWQAKLRAELQRVGDPYFADVWDRLATGQDADYNFYTKMMDQAMFPEQAARAKTVHTNAPD
jgi:arylsulfatase A-like enzyme